MFSFFKKQEIVMDNDLYSPIQGKFLNLEEVSDPVFSEKTMGDGFAIQPDGDELLVSPAAGDVMMVAATKHAIGITSDEGVEILIHIGMDTVSLNGDGFENFVQQNDRVTKGMLIARVDLDKLKAAGFSTITPVVIDTIFIQIIHGHKITTFALGQFHHSSNIILWDHDLCFDKRFFDIIVSF